MYLKSGVDFPVNESLEICEKLEIQDARAFLLEKAGNIDEALALILKTVDERLQRLVEAYENTIQASKRASGRHRHTIVDGSAASVARFRVRSISGGGDGVGKGPKNPLSSPAREELAVAQILDAALSLCRNSSENVLRNDRDSREKREQLWFMVLDAFDGEKRMKSAGRLKRPGMVDQEILHKVFIDKSCLIFWAFTHFFYPQEMLQSFSLHFSWQSLHNICIILTLDSILKFLLLFKNSWGRISV